MKNTSNLIIQKMQQREMHKQRVRDLTAELKVLFEKRRSEVRAALRAKLRQEKQAKKGKKNDVWLDG